MLLQRFERKSFLHRIVTGDEKWIYFENSKRKKSWLSPGEVGPSTRTGRLRVWDTASISDLWSLTSTPWLSYAFGVSSMSLVSSRYSRSLSLLSSLLFQSLILEAAYYRSHPLWGSRRPRQGRQGRSSSCTNAYPPPSPKRIPRRTPENPQHSNQGYKQGFRPSLMYPDTKQSFRTICSVQ